MADTICLQAAIHTAAAEEADKIAWYKSAWLQALKKNPNDGTGSFNLQIINEMMERQQCAP